MKPPYLSLVIPTSNDTYPSNELRVQNKCLSILQHQLERARLESEILVVEYNPDPSRPHLHESLRVDEGHYVTIKAIIVDPKYHRRYRGWEKRRFHQTLAVNVGLRRSRGRFLVYRAADQVYSEALVRFLGERALAADEIYRCDRVDVTFPDWDAVQPDDVARISRTCEEHVVRRHGPIEVRPSYHIPVRHTNASGDFLLMSRDTWMKLHGLHEGRYPIFLDYDSLALHAAHRLGNREVVLPDDCCVYKLDHQLKTMDRLRQVWTPGWAKLDRSVRWCTSETTVNRLRMLLNYPRREDATFAGVLLDSFERHYLLPAQLWARGFPIVRQNFGDWGLSREDLTENTLVAGSWDSTRPTVPVEGGPT